MLHSTAGTALIAIALSVFACGCSGPATQAPAPVVEAHGTSALGLGAGLETMVPGWNEFAPGGATTCSDGSPYRFFVRPGSAEKLMLYMMGGGGCWTRENCDAAMSPTYTRQVADDFIPWPFGIFDFEHPQNPFTDYTVVVAPYCTGDVHIGAADTVYPPVRDGQSDLTIHHQGYANISAVLDWTTTHIKFPERIFVTGSSAGAIPSPVYASLLAAEYPNARIAQLGDGAGGYRRGGLADVRPNRSWGTGTFLNSIPGFAGVPVDDINYEKLYVAAAQANPDITFARYDAAEDSVQKRFLGIAGERPERLLDLLRANNADIRAAVPNFRTFVVGGESHTVLGRHEFYTYGVGDASLRDWVAALANFEPVADVTCDDCSIDSFAGEPIEEPLKSLWASWQDPQTQAVEPFQIFDNVYYVGIGWVAAYLIDTGEGLILIDSLYGNWVRELRRNITKLGFAPADVKYVINTHGHFDHAGGSAFLQRIYGARIVMTEADWQIAEAQPAAPMFAGPVPRRDIVAADGDAIELGDTRIELFETPGHTEGVLTLRYTVRDGDDTYTAITLGGVGLNFSGVARTENYIASYERLIGMQDGVSVSLPNHAAMAGVFERAQRLAKRTPGEPHPFVDPDGYRASLARALAAAQVKLAAERDGTALDPMEQLKRAIGGTL